MKRLFSIACAVALVFTLGVSSAYAAEHTYSVRKALKPSAAAAGAATLGPLGSFFKTPSKLTPAARLGAFLPLAVGGNIADSGELPYPTADGTVDSAGIAHNVYWFYLESGAEIDFHLDATSGSQTSLQLFDPDATDVHVSSPILQDLMHVYPTTDGLIAQEDGYYYVDVYNESGTATYTLSYEIYQTETDEIPGVAVSASPMVRFSDAVWNWDNVNHVALRAGDTLTMHLGAYSADSHSDDFDVDLFLFGPTATSVTPHTVANPGYIASSASDGNDESVSYKTPVAGTYYMDAATYAGAGWDSLSWSVSPVRASVKRTAPTASKLTYKRKKGVVKFKLNARCLNQFSLPIKSAKVYLQWSKNGKTKWATKSKPTTNSNGAAGVTITAKNAAVGYYRWYLPASGSRKAVSTAAQKVTIK